MTHDERCEIALSGAGASKGAGLMDARELTPATRSSLPNELRAAFDVARGAAAMRTAVAGEPDIAPDIEAIARIAEIFGSLPWHLELAEPVSGLIETNVIAGWSTVFSELLSKHGDGVFDRLLEQIVINLATDLLRLGDDADVSYLNPLLCRAADDEIDLFTLNYDLALETAAEGMGLEMSTGIDEWQNNVTLEFGADAVRLHKLHGSIDWRFFRYSDGIGSYEMMAPGALDLTYLGVKEWPALVFGMTKMIARGPFHELYGEFRSGLARAKRLTTIGYSFRDLHINEAIQQRIAQARRAEEEFSLRIVDPGFPGGSPFAGSIHDGPMGGYADVHAVTAEEFLAGEW